MQRKSDHIKAVDCNHSKPTEKQMSFSSLDSLIMEIEDELKEKNEIEQEDSEY